MSHSIIPDDDGKGFTLAFEGGDVENVNPVEYYAARHKERNMALVKAMLYAKNPLMARWVPESFYQEKAEESWAAMKAKIDAAKIPGTLELALQADAKGKQEMLTKKSEFNAEQFAAFLFMAHDKYGFTFSNYITEQLPANIEEEEMPEFAHVKEDGTLHTAGETSLSEKQVKAAIQLRRVVVAKFLDRGSEWHCFFTVYRSLRGEETWRGGQPHFHYLSDKWGHSREEVVAMFKGDRYPITSVHIPYHEA